MWNVNCAEPSLSSRFPKKHVFFPCFFPYFFQIFFKSEVYIFDKIYYNNLVKRNVMPQA